MPEELEQIGLVDIEVLHHQFDVDSVIRYVHEGIVPIDRTYPLDLYRKYEAQRWNISELDFTQDKDDWMNLTDAERDTFLRVATGFHHGERQVAVDIVPLLMAAPRDEHKMYLTSQLEDETRHTLFFDRFYREVVGLAATDIMDTLDQSYRYMSETFIGSFGYLAYIADQIRRHPDNRKLLASGITNYHLWIEGVLALSVAKITLNFCKSQHKLPGFHKGFLATTRDESRHVVFGMKLLKELIADDPSLQSVVYETVITMLTMGSTYTQIIDYSPLLVERDDVRHIMMNNLRKKLNMVEIPIPQQLDKMISAVQPETAAGG
ncbi:MAG: ribonucleotide-diphosphate reductase subunit beta [Alicyclobacillaceae bacterium]|jgi:ribonucleoside-diphosphate reductase beta chain|nr:ribonucleotide-diphosphate reductase subunit beta [Alicyclobacillaceae bacterium]